MQRLEEKRQLKIKKQFLADMVNPAFDVGGVQVTVKNESLRQQIKTHGYWLFGGLKDGDFKDLLRSQRAKHTKDGREINIEAYEDDQLIEMFKKDKHMNNALLGLVFTEPSMVLTPNTFRGWYNKLIHSLDCNWDEFRLVNTKGEVLDKVEYKVSKASSPSVEAQKEEDTKEQTPPSEGGDSSKSTKTPPDLTKKGKKKEIDPGDLL